VRAVLDHPANRGRRGRQLLTAVRAQVLNRGLGRPAQVRLGERSRIWADARFGSSMAVAYSNPPDLFEYRAWQRHLQAGDLFVDAGANVGVYSVLAGELGASVVSIEAGAEAAAELRRNMALNGYGVEVHELAVADRVGEVAFVVDGDTMGGMRPGAAGEIAQLPSVTVPCTTLDEIVGDRAVAGLKLDVEGTERLVLQGAARLLARGVGLIQLEWNPMSDVALGEDRSALRELLEQAGYELLRPDEAGRLHAFDGHDYGADVFARPRNP
jgi:FkbM family methyltransferase